MSDAVYSDSWWLMYCDFPNLNWARLRAFSNGHAEVFDCDGVTHHFSTVDEARDWLFEDEFTPLADVDADDEVEYGIRLALIKTPEGATDEELRGRMRVEAGAWVRAKGIEDGPESA